MWTDVYVFSANPVLGITIATPFYENNELKAVLGVDLFLSFLDEFLSKQYFSDTGAAFIMDTEGYLIGNSYGSSTIDGSRIKGAESTSPVIQLASQFILDKYGSFKFTIPRAENFEIRVNGVKYLCTIAPLDGLFNLKWWSVITIPRSDWFRDIDRSGYITIGIGVGVTLIAILIAYFSASLVSRPLYHVKKGMER